MRTKYFKSVVFPVPEIIGGTHKYGQYLVTPTFPIRQDPIGLPCRLFLYVHCAVVFPQFSIRVLKGGFANLQARERERRVGNGTVRKSVGEFL